MNTEFTLNVQKRRIFCKNEDCIEKFGMEIPDQIHLSLSQQVIEKMKRMKNVLLAENISIIEILSSHCYPLDTSYATLYREEKELKITYFKYNSSGIEFPTIDLKSLVILCGADIDKFEVVFTYINALGETLKIQSSTFKID